MRAQHFRARVFRIELADDARPQQAAGAQLGNFHVEIHGDAPEEGQATGEGVDVQTGGECSADVFLAVGQRVSQLQRRVGTSFLNVITRNGNGVEFRQVFAEQ
jgi:hypothetical protein